jgi:CubicO group peptidase (beta-lactamase class C family)
VLVRFAALALLLLTACTSAASSDVEPNNPDVTPPPPADTPPAEDTTTCAEHQKDFDALAKKFGDQLASQNVASGALAIVCQSKRVFAKGFGNGITDTTRFQLASITKVFTSTLALRMAEKGKLRLDEPVRDQLTFLDGQTPYTRPFTWAELLSHSSGFPTGFDDENLDLEPRIRSHAKDPLWSPPGAVFNYSNEGFAVAGLGLQIAAGEPFGPMLEREVFANAGMTGASMDAARVQKEGNFATGVSSDGGGPVLPTDGYLASTYYGPMGGAWVSSRDLAKFAQTLIAGGGTLLTKDSLGAMTTPRISGFPGTKYGLGMEITDHAGITTWSHSGGVAGFGSYMSIAPSEGFAYVMMIASDEGWVELEADAFQAFTGKTLAPPATPAPQPTDAADTKADYTSISLGKLTVRDATPGLELFFEKDNKAVPLTPTKVRDVWEFTALDGYPDTATFWRENGAPKYLVTGLGVGSR